MKNQKLYDSLTSRFGKVVVHNEGEEAVIAKAQKVRGVGMMRKYLNPTKQKATMTGGEYYAVCCPYCSDSRFRLWVNYCYGEVIMGEVVRHTAICYNEGCNISRLANDIKPYMRKSRYSADVVVSHTKEYKPKEIALPIGCVRVDALPANHTAIRYLKGRYFTMEQCAEFDVRFCAITDDENAVFIENRLLFPFYLDGKTIGYQTRVINNQDKRSKYWLLPGSKKTHTFFGMDLFSTIKELYLVEGVFDAIRMGPGGMALCGKTISTYQCDIIKNIFSEKDIFIMLDMDATKNAYKVKKLLEDAGCLNNITVVPLDTKDPADTALWELQGMIERHRN